MATVHWAVGSVLQTLSIVSLVGPGPVGQTLPSNIVYE